MAQKQHIARERYLVMVLWWAGRSEAEIVRRVGLRSKGMMRGIRDREMKAEGHKPRSEMTVEERQAILDGMRAAIPEGIVLMGYDFIAKPLDKSRTRRIRQKLYDGGERVIVYSGKDPTSYVHEDKGPGRPKGAIFPQATTDAIGSIKALSDPKAEIAGKRPGRDGEIFDEEVYSEPGSGIRRTRNREVDQVESLYNRGLLHDPQVRGAGDADILSSRSAASRRHSVAQTIQGLMEKAGRNAGLNSIDFEKVASGSLKSVDPSAAAFMARSDLDEIRQLMPPENWRAIETLLTPKGFRQLHLPQKRRRRRGEVIVRRDILDMVLLSLDYAATWRRSGQDPETGRRYALLSSADFSKRWPDAPTPEVVKRVTEESIRVKW